MVLFVSLATFTAAAPQIFTLTPEFVASMENSTTHTTHYEVTGTAGHFYGSKKAVGSIPFACWGLQPSHGVAGR